MNAQGLLSVHCPCDPCPWHRWNCIRDAHVLARVYAEVANAHTCQSQLEAATRATEEAKTLCEELSDHALLLKVLVTNAYFLFATGDLDAAIFMYRKVIALATRLGGQDRLAGLYRRLSFLLSQNQDEQGARRARQQALALLRPTTQPANYARLLMDEATTLVTQQPTVAHSLVHQALALCDEGVDHLTALTVHRQACFYGLKVQGEYPFSHLLDRFAALCAEATDGEDWAYYWRICAEISLRKGELDVALVAVKKAWTYAMPRTNNRFIAGMVWSLAHLAIEAGDPGFARQILAIAQRDNTEVMKQVSGGELPTRVLEALKLEQGEK